MNYLQINQKRPILSSVETIPEDNIKPTKIEYDGKLYHYNNVHTDQEEHVEDYVFNSGMYNHKIRYSNDNTPIRECKLNTPESIISQLKIVNHSTLHLM